MSSRWTLTTELSQLVWIAPVPWDGIPGTDWQMASAMTRHANVLWVDPPLSVVTPARLSGENAGGLTPSLSAPAPGITRLSTVALPGLTRPGVRATTAPLLRAQIRWALRRLRVQPSAVVSGYLDDVLGRWDPALSVLYCTDDHVAGAGLMGLSASRLHAQERAALRRSDVVAVVSPTLAEHWTALGADPVLIPNGCSDTSPVPDDQAAATGLRRPVLGLVGQLSERIDLDILLALSDAGFELLIVGPCDPRWAPERFAALAARPGVRYTGRVPPADVPGYLAAIDIGITPYTSSEFNRASFPLKTLEYLAAGRPVVSSDLPGARWLHDDLAAADQAPAEIMTLASTPAEFVSAVRRLAAQPGGAVDPAHPGALDPAQPGALDPAQPGGGLAAPPGAAWEVARRNRCRAFARRHSWARRADALAAAIGLRPAGAPSPMAGSQPTGAETHKPTGDDTPQPPRARSHQPHQPHAALPPEPGPDAQIRA
jgi:teichuronic acid biosynthesis glycosyltransferase TuaH